ncbi:MAG: prolipoprotein diacylglyceryl transferase family protein [Acidimicrobiales bacterium]
MLAAIPYTTFPIIAIGPLELRTFGLMVGLGVLVGSFVAARYVEAHTGVVRDETYKLATRMVVAGVIGSRITWDITHWSEIGNPLDLIAVWKGGLQFSGGFIAAVGVGIPTFRTWSKAVRWSNLDGYAYGLCLGLAFGRVGCTSVGEHFGSMSDFFLAVRYDGGSVREPVLGATKLEPGMTFHNTSIYELVLLVVLFAGLTFLARRRPAPGTVVGAFLLVYAVERGLLDFLRVNDETVLGLTGAQWMCAFIIPISIWILVRVRKQTAGEPLTGGHDPVAPEPADGEALEPAD